METWFLADRQALKDFFGQGFRENALPNNPNAEAIAKDEVLEGLRNATRDCELNRRYAKGARSFQILGRLDAAKIRQLPHFQSLCNTLEAKLQPTVDG